MSFCRCEKALGMLMGLFEVTLRGHNRARDSAWNPCTFIHHLNCKTICIVLESALVHLVLPDTLIKNVSFKL